MKVILSDLKTENKQLKSEVKAMDKKLHDMDECNNALENRNNQLEQHHRGWSARILNVPLSPEEETDNISVVTKVYISSSCLHYRELLSGKCSVIFKLRTNCSKLLTCYQERQVNRSLSSCDSTTEISRTLSSSCRSTMLHALS
jgi:hypothetical protein